MENVVEIKVCVGSSCHVKGGSKTLRVLENLVKGSDMSDRIDLRADLCLGNCLEAPNVVVNNEVYGGVTPDKAEEFFALHVLPLLHPPD